MPGSERGRLVLLLIVWALTMLVGLGKTALWEPDEPRFAEATRQMFERGDFLTPWFNDRPRFEKPVLMYWLQAPFVAALGPIETAFRLPSALAGLLTLLLVYRMGASLVSPRAGSIGALVLATTFRFVLYARQGLTDVPVTAFVTLGIWAFLRAFDAPAGRDRLFALAGWAATGCAALTKGPVAIIGPLAWVIFALLTDRRTALRRLHAPLGIFVAAAIALPWHILMVALHGRSFLDIALGYEVVARYVSPDFPGRDRGFFYFYGVWLGDAAPWSLFFIAALIWAAVSRRSLDDGARRAVRLSIVWFLTVLLLFSFSSYKLPHYIMPAYPPTALLVSVFADAVLRGAVAYRLLWRVAAALTAVLLVVGAVLLGLLLRRAFALPLSDPSFVLPVLLTAGAVGLTASVFARRDSHVLAALLATLVAGYAWVIIVISPRELRRFQPIPALARSLESIAGPGEPLAVAGNYGAPGLVFYARRPVEQLVDRQELLRYLAGPGTRHCVLPLADFEAVRGAVPRTWRIVDEGAVFSVRMRRLLERAPERAGRTLVLVTSK
jgi:4-amino-4-deoxy-L-arabinose transferase-like glycosyltransferase